MTSFLFAPSTEAYRIKMATPSLTDASSIQGSDISSWRNSVGSSCTEFDDIDICSILDTHSEVVPLKVSHSVKRMMVRSGANNSRPPSLVIPATPSWPQTPPTHGYSIYIEPSSASDTPLSPSALALLDCSTPPLIGRLATPSLTGSHTASGESNTHSPVTPRSPSVTQTVWDSSLRLQAKAMDVLQQLSTEDELTLPMDKEVSYLVPMLEMEQLQVYTTTRERKPFEEAPGVEYEPISAISIPSPGAFFASLGSPSKQVWKFEHEISNAIENPVVMLLPSPCMGLALRTSSEQHSDQSEQELGRAADVTEEVDEPSTILQPEIDENYLTCVQEASTTNVERTRTWLENQENYLSLLLSPHPIPDRLRESASESPRREPPDHYSGISDQVVSEAPMRCVHFAEEPDMFSPTPSVAPDCGLLNAFRDLVQQSRPQDAFTHSVARFDALHTQRLYLADAHRSYLQGHFSVRQPPKPKQDFWCSLEDVNDPDAAKKRQLIIEAEQRRQFSEQVAPSVWNLAALKFLNNGSLLCRSALDIVRSRRLNCLTKTRILDIASQPLAGWGWTVALEHKYTHVFTAVPAPRIPWSASWTNHSEPANHRTVQMPTTTILPFPSNFFHIVSARTLHTLLRATGTNEDSSVDEWAAMLSEIHRVLIPGGVVQFSLLNAEPVAPTGSKLEALSNSFTSSLRSLGYDTTPSRSIMHRLEAAGFEQVLRTRMSLPLAMGRERDSNDQGCTNSNIEAVTGLVGSLAWEEWMLKVQHEDVRAGEDELASKVGEALAELRSMPVSHLTDGKQAGWKMLVGCAVKAESLYDDEVEDDGIFGDLID